MVAIVRAVRRRLGLPVSCPRRQEIAPCPCLVLDMAVERRVSLSVVAEVLRATPLVCFDTASLSTAKVVGPDLMAAEVCQTALEVLLPS